MFLFTFLDSPSRSFEPFLDGVVKCCEGQRLGGGIFFAEAFASQERVKGLSKYLQT